MQQFNPIHYIIATDEPMFFVAGLVIGVILMAIIDFIIDRIGE